MDGEKMSLFIDKYPWAEIRAECERYIKNIYYMGVDPGLNGSFVVISGDVIRCKLVMPTISATSKKGKRKGEIDQNGVLSFLSCLPPQTHAVIEEQIPVRNQHIQANHTTAKNYGILLMALTASHISYREVPSNKWQSHFGIVPNTGKKGKTTKQQALVIAQKLYPGTDFRRSQRAYVPHDGIVDAALIANYSQFLFLQTSNNAPSIKYIDWCDNQGVVEER